MPKVAGRNGRLYVNIRGMSEVLSLTSKAHRISKYIYDNRGALCEACTDRLAWQQLVEGLGAETARAISEAKQETGWTFRPQFLKYTNLSFRSLFVIAAQAIASSQPS